jgi:hypothetical protein
LLTLNGKSIELKVILFKMKTKSRIASILKANSLDAAVTGLESFHLSNLSLQNELDFILLPI